MKGIFTGKTLEEAKMAASSSFGVEIEKIDFNILEEPRKTLFGKIKGDAKVEAEYKEPAEVIKETECVHEAEPVAASQPVSENIPADKEQCAVNYIMNIFEKMGVKAEYTTEKTEEGISINLQSNDTSFVIGRRGENLDALQYLTSMVCNRIDDKYYRVILDSNGYRDKRKKTLEDLARKISKTVLKSGRSTALEPMNPYERRIIHSAVSEIEGVNSRSVGEEPYRKVIISSTVKRNDKYRKDHKKKNFEPKSLDLKTSFEKDYKKPKPDDDVKAGLYGKIEI
ncbi:MAG: RNA-binding cell elongation regulator Jag/EloR [Oscillospiraceae bacterium]|nr:RNA-binding cell elongation regulator Jag/EloR [Oscillospiraceae bacterium]